MKKLRLMFRWTFVFVLLGMLHVHANVYPQNGQQVTLSMKAASLKDVLWAIERQTSFVFMYNEEDLDRIGKVDVDVQGDDIRTILNVCLKGTTLTYVLQDNVIVLKPTIPQKTVKEVLLNGKNTVNYKLKEDVYATINGHDIPGKPKDLVMETSRDVSAGGACVILTDQVAYEVNVQNMMKVDEVKDQFLDGAPVDFKIAAMREKAPSSPSFGEGSASFIVTEDGRLFTRMRSANYLVGKYLTEPYYIDAKGYEITMLGHSTYGQNIPCYDAKNRRVVMATTWREDVGEDMYNKTSVYKTRVIPLKSHVNVPVSGFAEGTEMLYLSQKNHISWGFTGTSLLFTAYYNEPGADGTIIGDFGFDNRSAAFKYAGLERKLTLPVKLDASSVFLVSSNYRSSEYAEDAKYRDFYSVGNELYFVQRPDFYFDFSMRVVKFNATIPSKITSLAYAFFDLD